MRVFPLAVVLSTLPILAADTFLGTWQLNVQKSEFFYKDVRYQSHRLVWEMIGEQIRYREEGTFADGTKFRGEFMAEPHGASVKPGGRTTYTRIAERISLQEFGPDMLWVNAHDKAGKVVARWILAPRDGGKHLSVTQVTGGSSTRIFDRVE